jgi:hypothetical protein
MTTIIRSLAKEAGLRLVEARKPIVIELTREDIAGARQQDQENCGFARACTRMKGVTGAYFFRTTCWLQYDDRLVRYMLPPSVQREIVCFDRGGKMAPGTYQLSPPRSTRTLRAARKRSKPGRHKPKGTGVKRGHVHYTTMVRTAKVDNPK